MSKDYKIYTIDELEVFKNRYLMDLESYEKILNNLPADTFLGRFGVKAEIKLTKKKLNAVLEAIEEKKGK